eukprot:3455681-Rhodomonas_salina.5
MVGSSPGTICYLSTGDRIAGAARGARADVTSLVSSRIWRSHLDTCPHDAPCERRTSHIEAGSQRSGVRTLCTASVKTERSESESGSLLLTTAWNPPMFEPRNPSSELSAERPRSARSKAKFDNSVMRLSFSGSVNL